MSASGDAKTVKNSQTEHSGNTTTKKRRTKQRKGSDAESPIYDAVYQDESSSDELIGNGEDVEAENYAPNLECSSGRKSSENESMVLENIPSKPLLSQEKFGSTNSVQITTIPRNSAIDQSVRDFQNSLKLPESKSNSTSDIVAAPCRKIIDKPKVIKSVKFKDDYVSSSEYSDTADLESSSVVSRDDVSSKDDDVIQWKQELKNSLNKACSYSASANSQNSSDSAVNSMNANRFLSSNCISSEDRLATNGFCKDSSKTRAREINDDSIKCNKYSERLFDGRDPNSSISMHPSKTLHLGCGLSPKSNGNGNFGENGRDNLNSSTQSLLNLSRSLESEKTKKSYQTSTLDRCYRTKTTGSILNSDRSRYYQSREDGDRMTKPSAEVRRRTLSSAPLIVQILIPRLYCLRSTL